MAAHPLRKDPNWRFAQPSIAVQSSLVAIGPTSPKGKPFLIKGASGCREGTIHNLRTQLLGKLCQREKLKKRNPYTSWEAMGYRLTNTIDLEDPRNKEAGRTTLFIHKQAIGNRAYRKFLHMADAIMGPIGVLINPDRPRGCCKISTAHNARTNQLVWHGVDNTILYSPALIAMFAGLYRQCALLSRAGYADEVLSIVDRNWIRETIERADEESAREIIQLLKRWIETPVPRHGYRTNTVFPMGYFSRLVQVSRAIEKHGPRAVFSSDFENSWGLTQAKINSYAGVHRGLWSAWGTTKVGNSTYQKIAALSRSRKRNRPACRD